MKIAEIFLSIQGETRASGLPTVFIRTAGCNLSCSYCDTEFARSLSDGTEISVETVLFQIERFEVKRVTLTGGEPLLQEETPLLCEKLLGKEYDVQVETNGSFDISLLPGKARVIMDIKTPGSGMDAHNDISNISRLRPEDELKFVIASRGDYSWALSFIRENSLAEREVLFSPVSGMCDAKDLAAWILYDRLEHVRLQIQLHTVLWPGERGR